jgi:hypothetical protein
MRRLPLIAPLLALALGCSSEAPPGRNKAEGPPPPEKKAPAGPTAAKEGMEWTLDQLLAHLKAKGVVFQLPSQPLDAGAVQIAILERGKGVKGQSVKVHRHLDERAMPAFVALLPKGANFTWGRFVFEATPSTPSMAFLSQIQKVLTAS